MSEIRSSRSILFSLSLLEAQPRDQRVPFTVREEMLHVAALKYAEEWHARETPVGGVS